MRLEIPGLWISCCSARVGCGRCRDVTVPHGALRAQQAAVHPQGEAVRMTVATVALKTKVAQQDKEYSGV